MSCNHFNLGDSSDIANTKTKDSTASDALAKMQMDSEPPTSLVNQAAEQNLKSALRTNGKIYPDEPSTDLVIQAAEASWRAMKEHTSRSEHESQNSIAGTGDDLVLGPVGEIFLGTVGDSAGTICDTRPKK